MANQTETPGTMQKRQETHPKHAGGRPSKYTPELLRKAGKYLRTLERRDELLPTIEGLSVYLDISRERIYQWIAHDDKKQFRDIYRRIMAAQGLSLVQNGLNGSYNSPIAKLILSKHGYVDNQGVAGTQVSVTINRDSVIVESGHTLEHEK